MNNDFISIFTDNLDRADRGSTLNLIAVSGSATKHRKRTNRGDQCSLCSHGRHEDQPVDRSPEFRILNNGSDQAVAVGNDPSRLFPFFDAVRTEHERTGYTEIFLHTPTVHSRYHAIAVPGALVRVGGYGANGSEIFMDIGSDEIAVQVDRLSRDARFEIHCVSAKEAGFERRPVPSFRASRVTSAATLPRVAVSDWVRWEDLNQLDEHLNRKGCYMVGRFATSPGNGSLITPELVYVGITDRTLRVRLREFYSCATTHGSGHSGGCEFRRHCIPDAAKRFLNWPMLEDTFVRVISVDCPKSKAHAAAIHDLENRLIEAHSGRFGELPLCNRKG